jgi:DNA polymerase-3 subunit alpha
VRKAVASLPDWDRKEKLAREKEMLGFFVSGHPLDDLRETVLALPVANAASLKELPDRSEARTVGIITALKRKIDSKDRTMAFLTVEDYLGSYEVIAFSSVYGDCQARLQVDAIVALEGRTNLMESGEAKLLLDRVFTLEEALAAWPRDVHLHLAPGFRPRWLADLERELRAHPGSREVFFHLPDAEGKPVVLRARGLKVETGAWLADFLRAHRERLSCRLTPRPMESVRQGGWRGNGGNGRSGRGGAGGRRRGAAAPF